MDKKPIPKLNEALNTLFGGDQVVETKQFKFMVTFSTEHAQTILDGFIKAIGLGNKKGGAPTWKHEPSDNSFRHHGDSENDWQKRGVARVTSKTEGKLTFLVVATDTEAAAVVASRLAQVMWTHFRSKIEQCRIHKPVTFKNVPKFEAPVTKAQVNKKSR